MSCSILIVDDSETTVFYCRGLFEGYKCLVDDVNNFDEALARMKSKEYDLFIIDKRLVGDKDGTELIGKGSARPDKCIVLSEHLDQDAVEELVKVYRVPRTNIMVKPPDLNRFIPLAESILEKRSSEENAPVSSSDPMNKVKKYLSNILKIDLTWRRIFTFSTLGIFLVTMFTSYPTWKGYQLHQDYLHNVESYSEEKFRHFSKGETVTHSTFVEETIVIGDYKLVCRGYPDDFASVLIVSVTDNFEPRKYWLTGPTYAKKFGLNPDKTFLEVFLETWISKHPVSRL
jgi:CheY-like chemotaxis protein